MGGHVAIKTAVKYQDKISSIALLAPAINFGELVERDIRNKVFQKVDEFYIFGPNRLREEGVESIIKSNAMDLAEKYMYPFSIIHAKTIMLYHISSQKNSLVE